jgi:hypothetical protein
VVWCFLNMLVIVRAITVDACVGDGGANTIEHAFHSSPQCIPLFWVHKPCTCLGKDYSFHCSDLLCSCNNVVHRAHKGVVDVVIRMQCLYTPISLRSAVT